MVARVVKYDDDGMVLYDGPAKRQTDQNVTKKSGLPFGLTLPDLIKIGMMFVMGVVFVVKADQRIAAVEASVSYFTSFAKNSDGWNSSVYGTQFEGGKPVNSNIDMDKLHR